MDKHQCLHIIRSAVQTSDHPAPPEDDRFDQTSVMALLALNGDVRLVFIQKADIPGYPWANQMAFPGGHLDPQDRTTRDTALRELSEEMNIRSENVDVIGSLGHFQTINGKDIEAWIGIWNQRDEIRHDPSEISRVFQIPLKYLLRVHAEKGYHRDPPADLRLTYPYEDVIIWGVTAKIVYHLMEIVLKEG